MGLSLQKSLALFLRLLALSLSLKLSVATLLFFISCLRDCFADSMGETKKVLASPAVHLVDRTL